VSSLKNALPSVAAVVKLGAAADLLRGLRPVWFDRPRGLSPFFAPSAEPFRTFDLETAPGVALSDAGWNELGLSLHGDVASLIDALFDYRVLPFAPHSPGFVIPARELMLPRDRRDSSLATLGSLLGLDLAEHAGSGCGFLLLKMRRPLAEHRYEALASDLSRRMSVAEYWTAEARNAMGRLRVTRRIIDGADREAIISEAQAARYLEYFGRFGTHFVSRVEMGDLLLQVFAIHPARHASLRNIFRAEAGGVSAAGVQALGFRSYLGLDWVASQGRIVSVGDNPLLAASLAAGDWHDGEFVRGDSLLEALTARPAVTRALAAGSRVPSAIALDFAPQSSLMEVFRADAWKRLLKGAMLQRFGGGINIPRAHLPSAQVVPVRTLPRPEVRTADSLVRFDVVAEYRSGSTTQLAGRRVVLGAHRVDAGAEGDRVPILRLEEAALEDFEFIAGSMHGALFVLDATGECRDTICEGFRFTSDPAHPHRAVLRLTPSAEVSGSLSHLIEGAWAWMEPLLLHPAAADFARGFFEWVAAFWGDDSSQKEGTMRALNLARITTPSNENANIKAPPAALLAFAHDVAVRALRAHVEVRDPQTAPEATLEACSSDFARLTDRGEKLMGSENIISAPFSVLADESFSGFATVRHLHEGGRLLNVLLRLFAALEESATPEGFDLAAVAQALVVAAQKKCDQLAVSSRVKASET
jgi:hypothetical protein